MRKYNVLHKLVTMVILNAIRIKYHASFKVSATSDPYKRKSILKSCLCIFRMSLSLTQIFFIHQNQKLTEIRLTTSEYFCLFKHLQNANIPREAGGVRKIYSNLNFGVLPDPQNGNILGRGEWVLEKSTAIYILESSLILA